MGMCMTGIPQPAGIFDEKALIEMALELFPKVLRLGGSMFGDDEPGWLNRSCAVLQVMPAMFGMDRELMFVKFLGGEGPNYEKRMKYLELVGEKALRLESGLDRSYVASWETRDPEKDRYGGAVVLPLLGTETILSLSGLPEYADEAFCLLLGRRYDRGAAVRERCAQIVARTGNPFYAGLAREILGAEA